MIEFFNSQPVEQALAWLLNLYHPQRALQTYQRRKGKADKLGSVAGSSHRHRLYPLAAVLRFYRD
jgi:hypothetical protein